MLKILNAASICYKNNKCLFLPSLHTKFTMLCMYMRLVATNHLKRLNVCIVAVDL